MIPIRQRSKKLLIALIAAAALTGLFLSVNRDAQRRLRRLEEESAIAFSRPSGFYNEAFTLEILGGGRYDIRYTLDGSEPTAASPLYQKDSGLYIEDVSPAANRYASRTDLSAGYNGALLEKYCGTAAVYCASAEPVDKCTVLRAAVFDGAKRMGGSISGVYFVFSDQLENYQKLYTVSVTAEPDDLFGYDHGIMVTGKTQADYFASMAISDAEFKSQWHAPYWWWWPANYRNTGAAWERTAHICVFNEKQEVEMDQLCGIRVQGGGSRGKALRGLRCFARPKYAGADTFEAPWLADGVQPDSLVLFAGGDDIVFNLQDYLLQSLTEDMHFATMDFVPCALLLNGEFWGVYHIAEDYNAKFISDHYAVREDNVLMVKNSDVEVGAEYQLQLYYDMLREIAAADMRQEANYRRACELIDMESFIDYYAVQTYVARHVDWPSSNFAAWRTVETEESPYGDGRWRWMYFDVNSGALADESGNHWAEESVDYVLGREAVFRSLFKNRDFQKRYAERLLQLGDEILSPERCAAFIDGYIAAVDPLLQQTHQRIYNDPGTEKRELYVENLKLFFAQRSESIRSQLAEHLDETVAAELGL